MSRRMASRSPAMDRSMTVSAPAAMATSSLARSHSGWFWKGEVPILAFTFTREGCPTTMGRTFLCAGLPSSTMVPEFRACSIASGISSSFWEIWAICSSKIFFRAELAEKRFIFLLAPEALNVFPTYASLSQREVQGGSERNPAGRIENLIASALSGILGGVNRSPFASEVFVSAKHGKSTSLARFAVWGEAAE